MNGWDAFGLVRSTRGIVYAQFFGQGKGGSSTSFAISGFLIASRRTFAMSRTQVKTCMRWVKQDHDESANRTYPVRLWRMRNPP